MEYRKTKLSIFNDELILYKNLNHTRKKKNIKDFTFNIVKSLKRKIVCDLYNQNNLSKRKIPNKKVK